MSPAQLIDCLKATAALLDNRTGPADKPARAAVALARRLIEQAEAEAAASKPLRTFVANVTLYVYAKDAADADCTVHDIVEEIDSPLLESFAISEAEESGESAGA
jgi:hypothetical protein